ncbi:MAG: DUF3016 domain-containing protein [Rhodocyclaceae bacterium]
MRRAVASIILGLFAAAAMAAGSVTVRFISPDEYTDGDPRGGMPTKGVLEAFQRYFESAGGKRLRDGQQLTIEVLDIDLAGEISPRRGQGVRIMGDVTPPRIKLAYKLTEGDKVISEGSDFVVNSNYLADAPYRTDADPLFYEKKMLDAWFNDRIGKPLDGSED